jgi:hypothetical protein
VDPPALVPHLPFAHLLICPFPDFPHLPQSIAAIPLLKKEEHKKTATPRLAPA